MGAIRDKAGWRGTVVVLDDDPVTVRCLEFLLSAGRYQVQSFLSHADILQAAPPPAPACLVLDLVLDGADGLEVRESLKRRGWNLPTVVLTACGDLNMAVRAMRQGTEDFLCKPPHRECLIAAVERAMEKSWRSYFEGQAERELKHRAASLTPREREVICLVAEGLLNKQIAACLDLALITVKVHRGKAMRKLGARTPAELVRIARVTGICAPHDAVAPPLKGTGFIPESSSAPVL